MLTTVIDHTRTTLAVGHQFVDALNGYAFTLVTRSFDCRGLLFANDDHEQVGLSLVAPVRIPRESRAAVGTYLLRANTSIGVGNFDLDLDDGEWRFRYGIDVEGGELTSKMAHSMVGIAINAMDMHHDSIMHVAFGDADPEQALEALFEARLSEPDEVLSPAPETFDVLLDDDLEL